MDLRDASSRSTNGATLWIFSHYIFFGPSPNNRNYISFAIFFLIDLVDDIIVVAAGIRRLLKSLHRLRWLQSVWQHPIADASPRFVSRVIDLDLRMWLGLLPVLLAQLSWRFVPINLILLSFIILLDLALDHPVEFSRLLIFFLKYLVIIKARIVLFAFIGHNHHFIHLS